MPHSTIDPIVCLRLMPRERKTGGGVGDSGDKRDRDARPRDRETDIQRYRETERQTRTESGGLTDRGRCSVCMILSHLVCMQNGMNIKGDWWAHGGTQWVTSNFTGSTASVILSCRFSTGFASLAYAHPG